MRGGLFRNRHFGTDAPSGFGTHTYFRLRYVRAGTKNAYRGNETMQAEPNPRSSEAGLLTPGVLAVLAFTITYTLVATLGATTRGNSEFLIYIGVMCVLVAAVGYVHHRVRLTIATLWALSIWGLAHMAGGLVPVPESWAIDGEIRVLYSLWLIPD